jgi:hypothetical protein
MVPVGDSAYLAVRTDDLKDAMKDLHAHEDEPGKLLQTVDHLCAHQGVAAEA